MKTDLNKDSQRDLLDEFEFRPLSSGLGFHKANNANPKFETKFEMESPLEIKEALPRSSDRSGKSPIDHRPSNNLDFHSPSGNSDSVVSGKTPEAEISLPKSRPSLPDFVEKKEAASSRPEVDRTSAWTACIWEPGAIFLDALLVSAFFLICLMALIGVTQIDLFTSLSQPDPSRMIFWSLGSLWLALCFSYLSLARAFTGSTLGEWVFDQRLGLPQQMQSSSYVFRVCLRSLLTMLSGLIILPLISFALNRDFLGVWVGVSLYKKRTR